MIDSKFYIDKLRGISESTKNGSLKSLSNAMRSIIETKVQDPVIVLNTFIKESNSISDLSKEDKRVLTINFKEIPLLDLGLKKSYDRVIKESKTIDDPAYYERLKVIGNLVDLKEDYKVIDKVIGIFKTLPNDNVINEELQLMESNLTSFQNDVRVLNIIDYLKASEGYKKYKDTYNLCIEKLEDYLADPNAYTRGDAIDCLRELNYDIVIKEFTNYLSALNFADDTYNHSVPVKGSPAAGRVYSGGYLEKWHNDKEATGLGSIVVESIEEASKIAKDVNERTALKLLVERLSTEKLNKIERKVFNRIVEDNKLYDMGLERIMENIKTKSYLSDNLDLKKCIQIVEETKLNGLEEYKIVEGVYNILSKYIFDPIIAKSVEIIKENYNNIEERILIESVTDYIRKNPRLGMFKGLENDLKDYVKNPTRNKKHTISETYNKLSLDPVIKNFLKKFYESNSNISNPNPNEFKISKVYSIVEDVNGKYYYFKLNGRYFVKNNDEINIVSEKETPENLKNLSKIFESLSMNVVDEWKIQGYLGDMSVSIDINEDTGDKSLIINNRLVENTSDRDLITYVAAQKANSNQVNGLFQMYENLDSLLELDFVNRISLRRDPKIYADLIECNGNYYINFVNENIHLNKIVKTRKASTLRNQLYEYMEFDMTHDLYDSLKLESSAINELNKQAKVQLREIELCEAKLEKLETLSLQNLNEENREELNILIEDINKELLQMKKDYAVIISKITEAEDVESTEDENKDEKQKEDEISKFNPGDKVSHKPSKRTGEVTACNNKETCTIKFSDGSIQTVKIKDCSVITDQDEEEVE